jgi:predicted dehydrogenase
MAYTFGIIGGGWRSEFFLKAAQELPDRFHVSLVLERTDARGTFLAQKYGVRIIKKMEEIDSKPDFLVLSLSGQVMPDFIEQAVNAGHYVLSETFPAASIPAITELYKRIKDKKRVQFAEEYWQRPLHAAQLGVLRSGVLGTVSQAQVSIGHGYHGISLIRRFLGVTFENCRISGKVFHNPIVRGPGRKGYPENREIIPDDQRFVLFDFDKKWGLLDFTNEQYFSPIRSSRILLRGEQGEIANSDVRYFIDHKTPMEYSLRRIASGIEGGLNAPHVIGYSGGGQWYYRNPYEGARLNDDELAVAGILEGMGAYVHGGDPIYSLEEGLQDQYLQALAYQASDSEQPLESATQIWAK